MSDEQKPCAGCGKEFGAAVLLWTSSGEMCPDCAAKAEAPKPLALPPWPVLLAILFAVAPFFETASTTQSATVNGIRVMVRSYDYVAIPAGAIACLLGAWALVGQLKAKPRNKLHLWLAALAIPLGLFQLLVTGLGLPG